jgi:dolichol-phosphate mannosyltransferase
MSRLANRVRGALLHDGVRDSGCALKAMRREVVADLIPIRTLYSFIPALAVAAGHRVVEAPVNHRPRTSGVSSYGLRQFLWRPAVDMLGLWWFASRRIRPLECAVQADGKSAESPHEAARAARDVAAPAAIRTTVSAAP